MKNRKLSRALSDVSFSEIARQFSYKADKVIKADRFFPSTQLCSHCNSRQKMPLSARMYKCNCGLELDRDVNAAINLEQSVFLPGVPGKVTDADMTALQPASRLTATSVVEASIRVNES